MAKRGSGRLECNVECVLTSDTLAGAVVRVRMVSVGRGRMVLVARVRMVSVGTVRMVSIGTVRIVSVARVRMVSDGTAGMEVMMLSIAVTDD